MRDRTVLRHINAVRQEAGHDVLHQLPQAVPGDVHDCVFARAWQSIDPQLAVYQDRVETSDETFARIIAAEFGTDLETKDGKVTGVRFPSGVRSWIKGFDELQKEHLVDQEAYGRAKEMAGTSS